MGGLPNRLEASDIWRGIWFEEAHHSTAIEGNTLVLKQVEALLAEGRAVGDKQLAEYMEVRGYANARRLGVRPGDRAGRVVRWRVDIADRGEARPRSRDGACLGCRAPLGR